MPLRPTVGISRPCWSAQTSEGCTLYPQSPGHKCTGDLSRNRTVGLRIGQGESLAAITASMTAVAEGVLTSKCALRLRLRLRNNPRPKISQVFGSPQFSNSLMTSPGIVLTVNIAPRARTPSLRPSLN